MSKCFVSIKDREGIVIFCPCKEGMKVSGVRAILQSTGKNGTCPQGIFVLSYPGGAATINLKKGSYP